MLGRFIPREEKFFDLFEEVANHMVEAAKVLEKMMTDMTHAEHHAATIKDIEHRCDELTHRTMDMLHKTFRPSTGKTFTP